MSRTIKCPVCGGKMERDIEYCNEYMSDTDGCIERTFYICRRCDIRTTGVIGACVDHLADKQGERMNALLPPIYNAEEGDMLKILNECSETESVFLVSKNIKENTLEVSHEDYGFQEDAYEISAGKVIEW